MGKKDMDKRRFYFAEHRLAFEKDKFKVYYEVVHKDDNTIVAVVTPIIYVEYYPEPNGIPETLCINLFDLPFGKRVLNMLYECHGFAKTIMKI